MDVIPISLRYTLRKHKLMLVVGAVAIGITLVAVVISRDKKQTHPLPTSPVVDVVQVNQENVPLYSEWIGTTHGMTNADIRSQVSGYLIRKDYTEGAFVRQGPGHHSFQQLSDVKNARKNFLRAQYALVLHLDPGR